MHVAGSSGYASLIGTSLISVTGGRRRKAKAYLLLLVSRPLSFIVSDIQSSLADDSSSSSVLSLRKRLVGLSAISP